MSNAMPSSSDRDPRLYAADMLEFTQRALEFVGSHSLPELLADRMRYDAILRNLELIGEAATHVEAAQRAQAPDVPWRLIVATRNRVAHAYLGIAPETVWTILRDDLPPPVNSLQVLLEALAPSSKA